MNKQEALSHAQLLALLHYDPATGIFTWLQDGVKHVAGGIAGSLDDKGYVQIGLNGYTYKAHRLAWFYVTGAWPTSYIDHKPPGCKSDNRFPNLREATPAQNQHNRKVASSNRSGISGVSWNKATGKWLAQVAVRNKRATVGLFWDISAAAEAMAEARIKYHGEFARI